MYLGHARKRNGTYNVQFSTKVKSTWSIYIKLSDVETQYYEEITAKIKQASEAGNLPDELSLLAELNDIKRRVDESHMSSAIKDALIDLY
jgi:hypothetical protein